MRQISVGEKIKNAQNHLRCPEKWFLGVLRKMHILHFMFNFLVFFVMLPGSIPTISKRTRILSACRPGPYYTLYIRHYILHTQVTTHYQNIGRATGCTLYDISTEGL